MKLFVKGSLIILIVLIVGVVSSNAQLLFFGNPLVGKEAPDFTLPSLSGKDVNITQFRDGKNAIYFFWATWCPHCRNAISEINKNIKTFEENDIRVVLIDEGEKRDLVKAFAQKNKIHLEILLDEQTKLSETFSLIGLPTFIYVQKDGIVRAVKHSLVEDLNELFKDKK